MTMDIDKEISNYVALTFLAPTESLTEKNIGPSSANHVPSTAVTHCMYSFEKNRKYNSSEGNESY